MVCRMCAQALSISSSRSRNSRRGVVDSEAEIGAAFAFLRSTLDSVKSGHPLSKENAANLARPSPAANPTEANVDRRQLRCIDLPGKILLSQLVEPTWSCVPLTE